MFEEIAALPVVEFWELFSYIVTVIGLPWAVWLYFKDARRERENEEESLFLALSDEYAKFSNILLQHADLQLISGGVAESQLSAEQRERKHIIFEMLIALFERAYILVYEEQMDKAARRRWASWEDYIKFWLVRDDFRTMLPTLLDGEDDDFVAYMKKLALK